MNIIVAIWKEINSLQKGIVLMFVTIGWTWIGAFICSLDRPDWVNFPLYTTVIFIGLWFLVSSFVYLTDA